MRDEIFQMRKKIADCDLNPRPWNFHGIHINVGYVIIQAYSV